MATKTEVIYECNAFRALLWPLADDTRFTAEQRARFGRVATLLDDHTSAFALRPRYGASSAYYDNPKFWAALGISHMPSVASMPDDVCDMADHCIDSLEQVTAAEVMLTRGLRGALLSPPAAPAPPASVEGALSIRRSPVVSLTAAGKTVIAPGPTPPPKAPKVEPAWIEKLLKMFPAEAVTAYTFGSTSLKTDHLLVALVTLAAMLCVRWVALTPEPGTRPDWKPLAVSAGSFLLWVAATDLTISLELCALFESLGGKCVPSNLLFQSWAVYLILIWTWVVPVVVKEPQQQ